MIQSQIDKRNTPYVHQIYITDDMVIPDMMPSLFEDNSLRLREIYPDADYKLWSGNELREFIAEHFEIDVLSAFDALQPYSFKADLGRYCLLHVLGGLYVDISIQFVNEFVPPEPYGIGLFADYGARAFGPKALAVGIMWSEPKRPELMLAIKAIVQNYKSKYYGDNPLYPTGPVLFGKACSFAEGHLLGRPGASTQWIGTSIAIGDGPIHGAIGPNIAYTDPNNKTVAVRVKSVGGDLEFAGAKKVNNYNDIWDAGTVYGEQERAWPLSASKVSLNGGAAMGVDGVTLERGRQGEIILFPRLSLIAGYHRIAVLCSNFVGPSSALRVQVLDRKGERIIFDRFFGNVIGVTRNRMTVAFSTINNHDDIYIKLIANEEFSALISAVSYVQIRGIEFVH